MKKFFRRIILIVLIAVLSFNILKRTFPVPYSEYINKYADENNIERSLVYAVIKAESNFEENAHSHKNARGLMQLTEETALWCGQKMGIQGLTAEDIVLPETNIKIGIWYLKYLMDNTNSSELAIISYNAGINKVKQWAKDGILTEDEMIYDKIPYEETRNYIKKVMVYQKIYKYLYRMTS